MNFYRCLICGEVYMGDAVCSNCPFCGAKAKSIELQGIFKYLSKIEREHQSVARKILKCGLPDPEPGKEIAGDDEMENLRAALEREKSATAFYAQAAKEAVEPRVKKVFVALSEIESDHVKLEGSRL